MVEPIQGEGGVHVPNEGYLKQLRSLCDDQGWLLILDEIQTGNGRTGAYFAYQHENILPDVVTTAKGLGNGAPIGACIARGLAADTLQPGNHGSTFGGNPLATAAALAVVNTLTHDNSVINNAAKVGQYIVDAFNSLKTTLPCIQQVRGKGMMIGIQVDADCTNAVKLAAELGVLINITGGNTIRLLPPLNLTQSDADIIISAVANVITSITQ